MTGLEVFTYSGQQVRTVLVDGEPHFVASDVCAVLGIANHRDALGRLEAHERGVGTTDTPGGPQSVATVTESGIYALTFTSRKPEARDFRVWVTREVLPSIRRTGSYGSPAPRELSRLELIDLAREAELGRLAAEERVAVLEPAAQAWETVTVAAGADYSVAEAAQALANSGWPVGQKRLFDELHALGWILRTEGHWRPYQRVIDQGLLASRLRPPFMNRATGELQAAAPQVRVTAKGIERLLKLWQDRTGQLAIPAGPPP